MSDITVTSANVAPQKNTITRAFTTGGAVTVGYAVYLDSNGYVQHADSNVTATEARGIGIALKGYDDSTSIASGEIASVALFGEVEGFSGLTPGDSYYVSTNAGRLTTTKPNAYARAVAYAVSATTLFVNPETGDPASA
jgi:hypothetical protein